jgi:hypothetical protein
MKGIVFNLLEEVVRRQFGDATWDQLLQAAGLEGAYTSLGSYDDAELFKLVQAASSALNLPPDEVVRWFGRQSMPRLAEKYPRFFEPHKNTRAFVLTLNNIIHPEVRKLYPGAQVPVFEFDTSSADSLGLTYRSPRKLCALAEGLILGAADQYGETVLFEHLECMKRGSERCVWNIAFAQREAAPGAAIA